MHSLLVAGCLATIAWGALAFGAVYPWAFTPLAIAATAIGLGSLASGTRGRPPLASLARALGLVAAAIVVQLIPLPIAVLARISPGTEAFLREFTLSYASGLDRHAISLAPRETLTGLLLFATLAIFLLGVARLLSVVSVRTIVPPLLAFGGVLALVGIAQHALTASDLRQPLIYGFWKPTFESRPFGPFVNPNHFAGWMLMLFPVGLAAFFDSLVATIRSAPGGRSGRIDLVSSPRFGALIATSGAVLLMGLSIVLTRSRSALAAFAIGAVLTAWAVARRQATRQARLAVVGGALLVLLGAASWAGVDALVSKSLEAQSTKSLAMRISAWKDTAAIIRHFPLAGTGLNTYGTAMMQFQTDRGSGHFREAHNDYLQVAAEGGVLVGLPALIAIVVFADATRRRFREAPREGSTYWIRVGAVVGLVCIALQSLVEFSLQMPGNAALFALLAGIAVHRSPNLPNPRT